MKIYMIEGTGRLYTNLGYARNAFTNNDSRRTWERPNLYSYGSRGRLRAGKNGAIHVAEADFVPVDTIVAGEPYPWHNKSELEKVNEQIARLTAKRDQLMKG